MFLLDCRRVNFMGHCRPRYGVPVLHQGAVATTAKRVISTALPSPSAESTSNPSSAAGSPTLGSSISIFQEDAASFRRHVLQARALPGLESGQLCHAASACHDRPRSHRPYPVSRAHHRSSSSDSLPKLILHSMYHRSGHCVFVTRGRVS